MAKEKKKRKNWITALYYAVTVSSFGAILYIVNGFMQSYSIRLNPFGNIIFNWIFSVALTLLGVKYAADEINATCIINGEDKKKILKIASIYMIFGFILCLLALPTISKNVSLRSMLIAEFILFVMFITDFFCFYFLSKRLIIAADALRHYE